MKNFIAYFDYLGFKQFIENNDLDFQKRIIANNFRDIERALGKGKVKEASRGVIADLSRSKINCINFSDTIVFWTNDDTEDSLLELLEVAFSFNSLTTLHFFPARGSIVFGEIMYVGFEERSPVGGLYNINSVFGKGLVRAHEKAESQHWSGAVIDSSFIDELITRQYDVEERLNPFAKRFKVPYKNGIELPEEFVLRLVKGDLNKISYQNASDGIRRNFADYNKSIDNPDVLEKIENTLSFLKSFLTIEEKKGCS